MTTQQEKEFIKSRFNHYYNNCDDWSIDEIESRLRMDFWESETMTQEECFNFIRTLMDENLDG